MRSVLLLRIKAIALSNNKDSRYFSDVCYSNKPVIVDTLPAMQLTIAYNAESEHRACNINISIGETDNSVCKLI